MKEYIEVDAESFPGLMALLGLKQLICFDCGRPINKENYGLIALDFATCNDILCLAHGVRKFEGVKDA